MAITNVISALKEVQLQRLLLLQFIIEKKFQYIFHINININNILQNMLQISHVPIWI